MPQTYLFIQVSDDTYIPEILMKIDKDIRAQFSKRVFFVSKIQNARQALKFKRQIRDCFPGIDERT